MEGSAKNLILKDLEFAARVQFREGCTPQEFLDSKPSPSMLVIL
jgi:hypothetical protein